MAWEEGRNTCRNVGLYPKGRNAPCSKFRLPVTPPIQALILFKSMKGRRSDPRHRQQDRWHPGVFSPHGHVRHVLAHDHDHHDHVHVRDHALDDRNERRSRCRLFPPSWYEPYGRSWSVRSWSDSTRLYGMRQVQIPCRRSKFLRLHSY